MTLLEKINDRMDKRHKEGITGIPGEINISNPPLGRDPEARSQFQYITDANMDEQESDAEIANTIGTVHISRPSIKHVFFLLRPFLKPILEQFSKLDQELHELVKLLTMERIFIDSRVSLSLNVGYQADYKGRKFLAAMTLNSSFPQLSAGGNLLGAMNPGQWYPLEFPAGTLITCNVADASPITFTIRASDFPLSTYTTGIGTQSVFGVGGSIGINSPLTPNGGLGVVVGANTRVVFSNNQTSNANFTSADLLVADLATLDIDIVFGGFTGGTTPGITYNIARKDAFGNYNLIWSSGNKTAAFSTFLSIGAGVQQGSAPATNVSSVGVDFGDIIQINWVITGAPTSITQATTIKGKTY